MSAPSFNSTQWVPVAVLVASLVGSGHCVSMCGGLVFASARTRLAWVQYHLGRLAGYLVLGSLAGFLGEQVLQSGAGTPAWLEVLSWIATLVLGASFFLAGVRIWQGKNLHLSIVPQPVLSWLYRKSGKNAGLSGALTALLPCGWLHSFVLGAVATRNPLLGAGFLFFFWLGTLPALGLAPWLMSKVFGPLTLRSPKLSAVILIGIGVASLGMKLAPSRVVVSGTTEAQHAHCH